MAYNPQDFSQESKWELTVLSYLRKLQKTRYDSAVYSKLLLVAADLNISCVSR